MCSRTAHSICAAVCRDSAVEIFSAFFSGIGIGFNGYVDVGLPTAEGDDPACACVVATASGCAVGGIEADITGAGSVAVSDDTEDSIRALIDG